MSAAESIHARCPVDLGAGTRASPRHVVEVWLATPAAGGYQALLMRRVPAAGGFWQSVSGRVEPEDRTYLDAAFREVSEETGLDRAGMRVVDLACTDDFQGPVSGRWYRKRCVGLVLPRGVGAEAVRLSSEHDRVALTSFEEAERRMTFPGQVRVLARFAALLARLPHRSD